MNQEFSKTQQQGEFVTPNNPNILRKISRNFTSFSRRLRSNLGDFRIHYLQANIQTMVEHDRKKAGLPPIDREKLDPDSLLFMRTMDRIVENYDIERSKLGPSPKSKLILGTGATLMLTGALLAMNPDLEYAPFVIASGSLLLMGYSIVKVRQTEPSSHNGTYSSNPHNYPEGFDVSAHIKNSVTDINLDPDHAEISESIQKSLKDINLDPDKS